MKRFDGWYAAAGRRDAAYRDALRRHRFDPDRRLKLSSPLRYPFQGALLAVVYLAVLTPALVAVFLGALLHQSKAYLFMYLYGGVIIAAAIGLFTFIVVRSVVRLLRR